MRATQFWILLLGSTLVSILLIKQIFLSRAVNREQMALVDSQQTASIAPTYENLWKQLAVHIYQADPQDAAMLEILKNENVVIHPDAVPNGSAPATAPSTSSKTPAPPAPSTLP